MINFVLFLAVLCAEVNYCVYNYNYFVTEESSSFAVGMASNLIRVEFEVFGKVQGVFFRKYTQDKCVELDIKGWCMNTPKNTVQGVLEGEVEKVDKMKIWLKEEGSPRSKITNVVFSKETPIKKYSFTCFAIRG